MLSREELTQLADAAIRIEPGTKINVLKSPDGDAGEVWLGRPMWGTIDRLICSLAPGDYAIVRLEKFPAPITTPRNE